MFQSHHPPPGSASAFAEYVHPGITIVNTNFIIGKFKSLTLNGRIQI